MNQILVTLLGPGSELRAGLSVGSGREGLGTTHLASERGVVSIESTERWVTVLQGPVVRCVLHSVPCLPHSFDARLSESKNSNCH